VIRVPENLVQQLLNFAHELDDKSDHGNASETVSVYRTASDYDTEKPVNVAAVPQRSPFRYPGGKTWLVPYIRSWLRSKAIPTRILIEPFTGGGIAGLTAGFEKMASHVVLVELDANVAAVWHAIFEGQADWLSERIRDFRLSHHNVTAILRSEPETQRERAFSALLRNRVQRGGIMASGAGLVKTGENGRGLASRWYPETLARRILAIAEIKDVFTFIEGDGFDIIKRYADDETAAFFVDPPYTVAARRLYTNWQIDHTSLFNLLSRVKGDVIMTYDNIREVHDLAHEFGFQIQPIAMKNSHHAKMTELLIGKDLSWLSASAAGFGSATRTVQGTLAFPP